MSQELLENLKGRTKAAILLGFLPSTVSKKVGDHLDKLEVEIIGKEMLFVEQYGYDGTIIEAVLEDYVRFMTGGNLSGVKGGIQQVIDVFGDRLGQQSFDEILKRIYRTNTRPFDSLKKFTDIGPLLQFLKDEDPQTIAVVVMHMKPMMGAQLVEGLPEKKKFEVLKRIAKMEQTNKDILERIEQHLERKLEQFMGDGDSTQTDGLKIIVNILNNVPSGAQNAFFEHLEERDPTLGETIKQNMFTFNDIVILDQLMLQKVLGNIDDPSLIAKALKGAKQELQEKFYAAMPSKRKEAIDDISDGLIVKKKEVEESQQQIANLVRELEKKGEIVISRGDDIVL